MRAISISVSVKKCKLFPLIKLKIQLHCLTPKIRSKSLDVKSLEVSTVWWIYLKKLFHSILPPHRQVPLCSTITLWHHKYNLKSPATLSSGQSNKYFRFHFLYHRSELEKFINEETKVADSLLKGYDKRFVPTLPGYSVKNDVSHAAQFRFQHALDP